MFPVNDRNLIEPSEANRRFLKVNRFSLTPQQLNSMLAGKVLVYEEDFGDVTLFQVSEPMKERYDLKALKKAADEAIAQAMDNRSEIGDNVNWGNLCCISAQSYQEDDGGTGYTVWISEADPRNIALHNFIYDALVKSGFAGVEVKMEW